MYNSVCNTYTAMDKHNVFLPCSQVIKVKYCFLTDPINTDNTTYSTYTLCTHWKTRMQPFVSSSVTCSMDLVSAHLL